MTGGEVSASETEVVNTATTNREENLSERGGDAAATHHEVDVVVGSAGGGLVSPKLRKMVAVQRA